jgi:hypothetical protein
MYCTVTWRLLVLQLSCLLRSVLSCTSAAGTSDTPATAAATAMAADVVLLQLH